jgi:hypothetical protein
VCGDKYCTLFLKTLAPPADSLPAKPPGRCKLTPSQKAALALELEKQLAAEAKKRQRLNNANRAILPEEKGRARDLAAKIVGALLFLRLRQKSGSAA